MNRRKFLLLGSASAAALSLTNVSKLMQPKLFGAEIHNNLSKQAIKPVFSLDILTDQPETALQRANAFISEYLKTKIRFEESLLSGKYIGDMVFIINNKLLDYHDVNSNITKSLNQLGKDLSLPKNIENPVLLSFRTQTGLEPEEIKIFSGNFLINSFKISENHKEITVPGKKGELTLSIQNGAATVLHSSCKHKTCMKMGSISRPGENIICIPNQVRISIEGKSYNKTDTLTY